MYNVTGCCKVVSFCWTINKMHWKCLTFFHFSFLLQFVHKKFPPTRRTVQTTFTSTNGVDKVRSLLIGEDLLQGLRHPQCIPISQSVVNRVSPKLGLCWIRRSMYKEVSSHSKINRFILILLIWGCNKCLLKYDSTCVIRDLKVSK